jgi:AAA-like domain
LPVQLPGFDRTQALYLAELHGWANPEIDQVLELVGGHPYLTQIAMYHLGQQQLDLPELLKTAPTYHGIYGNHLRHYLVNLQAHPDLVEALRAVVTSDQPVALAWSQLYRLDGMGLIKLVGNLVEPSCTLYRRYFQMHLA